MNSLLSANSDLELLNQLIASATHDASAAMCRWTGGLITLTLDEVRDVPLAEVCPQMHLEDQRLKMVILSLDGTVGGQMILAFDDENGRQLAATLMRTARSTDEPWTELELSALSETANILGCAYMNALTRLIGVELVPSPPYLLEDYAACVLQQAVLAQAADSDQVLICRTRFEREGADLHWHVFFVPTPAMRQRLDEILATQPAHALARASQAPGHTN